jgi:hypothetical protein
MAFPCTGAYLFAFEINEAHAVDMGHTLADAETFTSVSKILEGANAIECRARRPALLIDNQGETPVFGNPAELNRKRRAARLEREFNRELLRFPYQRPPT